jgi:hypothetical protein
LLLEVGKQLAGPEHLIWTRNPGGEFAAHIVMLLQADADLMQIVFALNSTSFFASGLNGRQKDCAQNANDSNGDE